jgi:hypothetical protein
MVTARQEAVHIGSRPSWDCRVCRQPWPCAPAKGGLLSEFRSHPSSLMVYMSAYMYEAMNDLTAHGEAPPPDLYERFLSWVRPAATGLHTDEQPLRESH